MNRELEKFIKIYLDFEQAYDNSGFLRPTLHAFRREYVDAVREGLISVLRSRELSIGDYERLTDIQFDNEESLYAYLEDMYRYLFEDGAEQPLPPDA
ncbi:MULTISPECIES: hypothetical protein [Streptomyces]|jgi:hypothetical protein|uniref:hypothetical protein n=1 Tax=Streptomyces TaxID=1883 RepID=UPI000F742594|nr:MULTISPECIES: hypothetical protein [Streptomyces]MCM3266494.1 hypothetical protein [Streptomyces thermoviolaceus]RSR96805.1 hypothetical protein EF917_22975 [Streptomyces sp. WAC00469]